MSRLHICKLVLLINCQLFLNLIVSFLINNWLVNTVIDFAIVFKLSYVYLTLKHMSKRSFSIYITFWASVLNLISNITMELINTLELKIF